MKVTIRVSSMVLGHFCPIPKDPCPPIEAGEAVVNWLLACEPAFGIEEIPAEKLQQVWDRLVGWGAAPPAKLSAGRFVDERRGVRRSFGVDRDLGVMDRTTVRELAIYNGEVVLEVECDGISDLVFRLFADELRWFFDLGSVELMDVA